MPDPHYNRERQQREDAMDRALESLRGLFPDGLVLAGTWQCEDGTSAVVVRCDGNWYTQNGLMDFMYRKRVAQAQIEAEQQAAEEDRP